MNKLVMRIGMATAGAVAWGLIMAPATLADTGCLISGNGARSHNRCTVNVNKSGTGNCRRLTHNASGSVQTNSATVTNNVTIHSNTGGNHANLNTGGNVSITSGDSNVNVIITNVVNSNISN